MTEGPRDAAMTGVELNAVLLDAKLSVPQPRPGSVARLGLIQTARTSGCRVIGVTAAAGYGKSTLLMQWAAAEERRVAWVSLDRFDDDPAVLLGLLAAAYTRIFPGDIDVTADMGGLGISVLGRAAPRLASAFRASPVPFVLILDDLHEVRSPACHDVLGVVISGVPRGSQLVAASRSEQPHLARLRASGDALEFGAADLALDAAGAEQIFANAQVHLTHAGAVAVTERTEGWPVGLQLAAMIARDSNGQALPVSGDDRFVADYLYREASSHQPEGVQRFLRRTAVLDQLSAPLCDAVLGEMGAQQQFRDLEAGNLFLVALDRRRDWFRYHTLFREFLLSELRRVEPGVIPKLQLRAADWYEANGSPAMAIEHLLSTTERQRCVTLVTQMVLPTYQAGHLSTVQRWLTALGDSAITEYPPLTILAGYVAVHTGQTTEAQRWAAIIETATFDSVPVDGTASFDSARAMFRALLCPAGPEQMLIDAAFAVEQEPAWSEWRDNALLLLAHAHLLAGDADRAASLFEDASALAAAKSNVDCVVDCESELAVLAMDQGRWVEAGRRLGIALAAIEQFRMHDYPTCLLAFAAAARLSVHHSEVKEAERHLTSAMRARPYCTFVVPLLAVRLRLQLAITYRAMGDPSTSHQLLREIDDILLHRPALGVLVEQVSEFRGTLAAGAPKGAGGSPLTPAELRLLPYLQTHLTIREIGDRLFVSRNTASTEISAIYRKLGVSSRSDAVRQATSIGLLGGQSDHTPD